MQCQVADNLFDQGYCRRMFAKWQVSPETSALGSQEKGATYSACRQIT